MIFYTKIPTSLSPYFQRELQMYREEYQSGRFQIAWSHLERAHIIGQRYPFSHSFVHWEMLLFGFRIKNPKEIIGQIPRLLVGGVKFFVGKVPVGNPGGANVPPLKSFEIAQDMQDIFSKAGVK